MRRAGALLLALGLLVDVASAQSVPPRRKGALRRWLEAGVYTQTFTPEASLRPSATAHGRYVRTWLDPTLVADLRAGRMPFTKGASMVKELWSDDQQRLVGWAVMRKLRRRSGARGGGWLFYETVAGSTYYGRGLRLCTSCHTAATEFLLTAFVTGASR